MWNPSSPNPAARFLILAFMILFYTWAVIAYFRDPVGFFALVAILGAVGTGFLLVFLFGSDQTCDATCHLFTLGMWP